MTAAVRPSAAAIPTPDRAEMRRALDALYRPDDLIELRAIYKARKRTDAGYFDPDHRAALIAAAAKLNSTGAAVYVPLNPIDPQLLGRYTNRLQEYASATATDANVTRRRWLLLDFDPVRPKDTSATEAQFGAAKGSARGCYQALRGEGWPDPLVAESGNGMHLLYPIDLPNDAESRDLTKGALAGLAQRFDNAAVTVDQAVFNAARIIKLYGTVANKGDHTATAPWRLSRLVSVPKRDRVVTVEQLRALHPPTETRPTNTNSVSFDLADFLSRLGIGYTTDTHEGRERYRLDQCPFDPNHGKGEAAVFRCGDGKLGFHCFHNACVDKTWRDVRALVDGPREARRKREDTSTQGTDKSPFGSTEGRHNSKNSSAKETETIITCAADVQPQPITWLWPGRVAIGKLTIIAGDPGLGKSMVTIDMAAHVTRGMPWPVDHAPCALGDVLMLSAEDDLADTIRPRLDAANADVKRVHVLSMVRDVDGDTGEIIERSFSLKRDIARLCLVMARLPQCRMVVIDPISAYLDGTDSHTNADVRGLLAPLANLAHRSRVAVVAVTHLRKSDGKAIHRTIGSIAFAAAARAVLVVARDPNDEQRRLVLPAKNNLGPDTGGFAYSIATTERGVPYLQWAREPVTMTADDALSSAAGDDAQTERESAAEWLREVLAEGSKSAKEVRRQADDAGYAWRTVHRAKDMLGVKPTKTRFDGNWQWALSAEDATDAEDAKVPSTNNVAPSGGDWHLRENQQLKSDFQSKNAEDANRQYIGTFAWMTPAYEVIPEHVEVEV